MPANEHYIRRCIELAKNGLGTTRPNPSVGCVIVNDGVIIGEGFTSFYGGPHAEVNAINAVADKSLLSHSTLYVSLEPCSHHGKTPPCSDLIIEHSIPNVVIGTMDTNNKVSGKGIAKLNAAGCKVLVGVLEEECKAQHKRFFTFQDKNRPYIILKWAESEDGFIAPLAKEGINPFWITNPYSRQLVHKWRTEEHAILIGTTTILKDNPSLTSRDWKGNNPSRVVIDKCKKLNKSFSVFDSSAETILISEDNVDFNKPLASQICTILHSKKIQSVIIEGGAKTLQTFIAEGLWDEARVFTGAIQLKEGIKAPHFSGDFISEDYILEDQLKIYHNNL